MGRPDSAPPAVAAGGRPSLGNALRNWLRGRQRAANGETSLRDTLDRLIEKGEDVPVDEDQRVLLANILDLRDRTVHDVMVPRVDIVAIDAGAGLAEVIDVMTQEGHSRLPVYRGNLDDTLGMVHIKDVLVWHADGPAFVLSRVLRQTLFVSPAMRVLELLLEMRVKRVHMALVVDEFGGIDGIVTIEDLVEEIVGEIEDEHDRAEEPELVLGADGCLDADARVTVEALEALTGFVFSEEEREDIDTLGGLVFSLAGRVPIRGELIRHASGLEFEVVDADPRRIKRLRVHGLPAAARTAAAPPTP